MQLIESLPLLALPTRHRRQDPVVRVFWAPTGSGFIPGNTSFVATDTDLIQVDQHICRILINAVGADLLKFFSAVAP
jgi:hypothetical protein